MCGRRGHRGLAGRVNLVVGYWSRGGKVRSDRLVVRDWSGEAPYSWSLRYVQGGLREVKLIVVEVGSGALRFGTVEEGASFIDASFWISAMLEVRAGQCRRVERKSLSCRSYTRRAEFCVTGFGA